MENGDNLFPYPGVTRSRVWKHFGFLKIHEGPASKKTLDMSTVICKVCKKSYANKGNTTNLQFHLDKHHQHEISDQSASKTKQETKLIQTKLSASGASLHMQTVPISTERKRKLSIVKSEHFLALTKELDSRYRPPTGHEFMQSLYKKKTSITNKVLEALPPTDGYISLTHDGWTSCATQSYSTVTAHFIHKQWNLRSVVLQTSKVEGAHTAENIAAGLKDTVAHWKLPIPTVVTDNAANEKKAMTLLDWERFGCYGHRINLVVKHSLEVPAVGNILAKCRKLVTYFNKSTSANDCMMEKQVTLFAHEPQLIGHKLIADVPTRWNSSLSMLQRVVEQMPAIMAVANDNKLSKPASDKIKSVCLTFEEQTIVEDLIKVLSPFQTATTILCAESCPTMNKVLVTLSKN